MVPPHTFNFLAILLRRRLLLYLVGQPVLDLHVPLGLGSPVLSLFVELFLLFLGQ